MAMLVVKEARFAETRDVEIVPTIVVVIAYRHAHTVHFHIQAGLRRDIGKGAVAVIAVKLQSRAP